MEVATIPATRTSILFCLELVHSKGKRCERAHPTLSDDLLEDEACCPDHVVYHGDHLDKLRSLYTRTDMDVGEDSLSLKHMDEENRPWRQESCSLLPSAQETAVWDALEKTDVSCWGEAQVLQYETGSDFRVDDEIVEDNGEQEQDITMGNVSKPTTDILPAIDTNDIIIMKDPWDQVFEASEHWDGLCSDRLSKFTKEAAVLLKNPKGVSKQKLKFSFRPASDCTHLLGPNDKSVEKQKNISIAEQLQNLCDSDDLHIFQADVLGKEGESKKSIGPNCAPIAEQLQELYEQDASFLESRDKGPVGMLISKRTRKPASDYKSITYQRGEPLDEDIAQLDSSEDDLEQGDGTWRMVDQRLCDAGGLSMNERLHEALTAAHNNDYNVHSFEKQKGYVSGFVGKLQKILHHEKSQRAHFMKALQMRRKFHDDGQCLEVQILAKSSESRLISCTCEVIKLPEHWKSLPEELPKEMFNYPLVTVIFNTRTNQNLELEVGNVVCIHPPWQEVALAKGRTILCTYFCEMITDN